MNPEAQQLLQQLRDIHAAAAPPWWPPAPGWWLLALILLLLLAWCVRVLLRRLAKLRRRRAWLRELRAIDARFEPESRPHDYLAAVNRLFRAVALEAFPETSCARLHGSEWVAFIRSALPENEVTPALSVLAQGPYDPVPEFDAAALQAQARCWVKHHG